MPIATLFDDKKEDDEENDDRNELYTGGNRRGGLNEVRRTAGNAWGAGAISNAEWGGVLLRGGKRTETEKMEFDWMLQNARLLYLGCTVLILLDLSYLSRFWWAVLL